MMDIRIQFLRMMFLMKRVNITTVNEMLENKSITQEEHGYITGEVQ